MSNITPNKIIFATREDIRSLSDDSNIDDRNILFEWNNQRALYLRRNLDSNSRIIDESLIQDLGCVELEMAPAESCCDFDSTCKIIRTKKEIPAPLSLRGNTGLTRVGSIDKFYRNYSIVTYEKALYSGRGRASQYAVYAFYLNNRVHLMSKNPSLYRQKWINIRGLFQNPEDISTFTTCDGDPCFTWDSNYPITADMVAILKPEVVKILLQRYSAPTDNSNNASDDTEKIIAKGK